MTTIIQINVFNLSADTHSASFSASNVLQVAEHVNVKISLYWPLSIEYLLKVLTCPTQHLISLVNLLHWQIQCNLPLIYSNGMAIIINDSQATDNTSKSRKSSCAASRAIEFEIVCIYVKKLLFLSIFVLVLRDFPHNINIMIY